MTAKRLIRLRKVLDATGDSRSSWYRKVAQGSAPKLIAIGPRASAWIEDEVNAYVERLIAASRGERPRSKAA